MPLVVRAAIIEHADTVIVLISLYQRNNILSLYKFTSKLLPNLLHQKEMGGNTHTWLSEGIWLLISVKLVESIAYSIGQGLPTLENEKEEDL